MKAFFKIILFLILPIINSAQKNWYVNFSPGIDFIPPAPLVINQDGYSPISFWADYESAPLKSPFYYSVRLGFSKDINGWEIEMNHLKIYLKNNPSEVQNFSISHGYNQFFINRVIYKGVFKIKTGGGIVIAHPENTIRNFTLDENKGIFGWGYYLAGPAIQKAISTELFISERFFLIAELKATLAYANVPVVNGRAHAPVLALHLQFGPGFYFKK